MKSSIKALLGTAALALIVSAGMGAAPAAAISYGPSGICPVTAGHPAVDSGFVGSATDCNLFITFEANGSVDTSPGLEPNYDSSDDALIGVTNLTSHAITSFHLDGAGVGIFGFEGDGIDLYTLPTDISPAGTNPDTTGYGGYNAFFTGIGGGFSFGDVNFANGGIPAGGHDFFALEQPLSLSITLPGVPEPATIALFGAGLAGLGALRRRKAKKA